MIRHAAVLLGLIAGPSQAMIECIHYDEMVAAAPVVVQIEGAKIGPADANGNCAVSGQIDRAFRGAEVGGWIETLVACDNPQGIVGPVLWTAFAQLKAARVIELHLQDGQVAGYGAGIMLLRALTDAPAWEPACEDG